MIDLDALYADADFTSDEGVSALCEKMRTMDVSENLLVFLLTSKSFIFQLE